MNLSSKGNNKTDDGLSGENRRQDEAPAERGPVSRNRPSGRTRSAVDKVRTVARNVAKTVLERYGLDVVVFCDVDPERMTARFFAECGAITTPEAHVSHDLYEFFSSDELMRLRAGGSVVIENAVISESKATGFPPSAIERGSVIHVAGMADGQLCFLLSATSRRPTSWHPDDTAVLKDIVDRVYVRVERARRETALVESEERFREIADSAPVLMWISDPEGGCAWVNKPWLEFTGRELSDELGEGWIAGVHSDDAEPSFGVYRAALNKRRNFTVEYRLRRHDGEYRWVLAHGAPRRNAAGEFLGHIGSCIDITDRKLAEEALQRSERLFDRFMHFLPGLAWIKDADGKYIYANDAAIGSFGTTRKRLYGRTDDEIFLPEIAEAFKENDAKALAAGGMQAVETLRHRDGSLHYSIVHKFPIELLPEQPPLIGGMAIDITEQRRAQEALRAREAELQLIADVTPIILVRCSSDLRYQFMNQAGAALFGKTPEEMVGQSIRKLMGRKSWARIAPHVEQVLRGNSVEFETQLVYPAAGMRWMRVHYMPEVAENGTVTGWVASIIDVTELRTAQQAMVQNSMLIELSTEPIFAWNLESGIIQWNKGAEMLYGYTRQEALGRNSHQLLRTIHGEGFEKFFGELKLTRFWTGEVRHLTKEGRQLIIESRQQLLDTGSGTGSIVLETNRDITDRRLAEERLRRNERELRVLTDSMPALICYIDAEERYRFVNRTYTEWFQKPREEIIGKKVRSIMGDKAYREVAPQMHQALEGVEATFQAKLEYKTAGTRSVHISYVPDVSSEGDVRGFYGLISDITELTHSRELLRTAEQRLGMIVDNVTDYAVFSLNRDARIDSWNAGAEHVFGWGADEILGLPGEILFLPEDVEAGVPQQELKTARETGRASDDRWHIKKDGTRFFASGVTVPLYIGQTLTGYAKVATDLTERQKQAEALQRAHDELEERVAQRTQELANTNASLVQEIENRKAAEQQRIDLLRRLVSSQEFERSRIARDIHDQLGQRLTALRLKIASIQGVVGDNEELTPRLRRLQEISEHLDSEVSFLAWELRPMALDDLGLAGALSAFVREWSKHHEIEADFHAAGIPKKRLDTETETHLYRITQEALNNITKHAAAQSVTVLLEKRGEDELVLVIEDDGRGFDREKIVPPDRSGRGLGLTGMGERAALIGGTVEIESAPGQGTAIFVRVPLRTERSTRKSSDRDK